MRSNAVGELAQGFIAVEIAEATGLRCGDKAAKRKQ